MSHVGYFVRFSCSGTIWNTKFNSETKHFVCLVKKNKHKEIYKIWKKHTAILSFSKLKCTNVDTLRQFILILPNYKQYNQMSTWLF